MAIGITDLDTDIDINSTTDGTSFSSNIAFTASASVLMVLCVQAVAAAEPTTPTITHDTVTAEHVYSHYYTTAGGNRRKLFVAGIATRASPASTVLSLTFGATVTACQCYVVQVTGSDVINGVTQSFVQGVTTAADVTGVSGSVALAAAGHADNRPFAAWGHGANETTTLPRTNWTEIDEQAVATPNTALETQWRSDAFETTSSASWDISAGYGGLAFEIKALVAGGGGAARDPFGMTGFFGS